MGCRKGLKAEEVWRRGHERTILLSLPPHGYYHLPILPDLAGHRPCQRSLSVLSPRQPAQNQGIAYFHYPRLWAVPFPPSH